eukprot:CAMPEP_0171061030 /NCGR_PEP_ID=MMETSP0766_2-20121228/4174_1 /TAXON_ID=439317 /ORGANISM="Gambierdiscus australes, Strain CAWD 149" /LENGTH=153 /DNA_ID=CAMNT_0011516653 /DNA_START=61 /DNA_END=522 /DNA_ORIENTATION=-
MPRDLMLGIFGDDDKAIPKKEPRERLPFYKDRGGGFVHPQHFDNDKAIELYEENLQDLSEASGMRHQGLLGNATGLVALYDMKAGIEKNVKYYDKAIEYIEFAEQHLTLLSGPAVAPFLPPYQELERRKAKILRKKERRLAKKAASGPVKGVL